MTLDISTVRILRILKMGLKIRDVSIFHCLECKLYFYLRTAVIYNKSLQTVHASVSIEHVNYYFCNFVIL